MIEHKIAIYCDLCGEKIDVIAGGKFTEHVAQLYRNRAHCKTIDGKFLVSIDISLIDYDNSIAQGTEERTDLCDTCIKTIIASINTEDLKFSRSRALMEDT